MNADFNRYQKDPVNVTASSSRPGNRPRPPQIRTQQQNPRAEYHRDGDRLQFSARNSYEAFSAPPNAHKTPDALQRNGRNGAGRRTRGVRRKDEHSPVQEAATDDCDIAQMAEMSRSEARQQQFNKTKLCKFFIMGICTKSEQCQFAHDKREMRPLPNLGRTKLCKTLIEKGMCRNVECTYAHSKDELRATSAFLKTKLCKFYMSIPDNDGSQETTCALGDACRYAHSEAELKENLDEQARITQEQLHLEHHANSSGSPNSRSQHTQKSYAQSLYSNGQATPSNTHLNLDYQIPHSPHHLETRFTQRPKASVGSPKLFSPTNMLSPKKAFRMRNEPENDESAGFANEPDSLAYLAPYDDPDIPRLVLNATGSSFGASHWSSRQSSAGSANDSESDLYDVWAQQLSLPLPQIGSRVPKSLPSKPIGGLRKNTLTANSFASLEVLAEDEPAFVALSECEEDGCKIERASIVTEDPSMMGEHTVTAKTDSSWVVKNTFIEFRDEDGSRPAHFPLRNVRSAFACLSSLDNFKPLER